MIVEALLKQGICALQYRRKQADFNKKYTEAIILRDLCSQFNTPLIINDDIDLCCLINADGVHLGSGDTGLVQAIAKLPHKIIGVSCYNNIADAKNAQQLGASYVAFGALFTSKTKPVATHCPLAIIKDASKVLSIPIVGIGGINHHNKQLAYDAGCNAVAMINALFSR